LKAHLVTNNILEDRWIRHSKIFGDDEVPHGFEKPVSLLQDVVFSHLVNAGKI